MQPFKGRTLPSSFITAFLTATPAFKRYSPLLSLSHSRSLSNQRDCGSSVCATSVSSPMKTLWDDTHFDDTKANSFLLLQLTFYLYELVTDIQASLLNFFKTIFFFSIAAIFFKTNFARKLRSETAWETREGRGKSKMGSFSSRLEKY